MSAKQTITVNGRHYDARTGLAIDTPNAEPEKAQAPAAAAKRPATVATHVHATTQRSHTLNRKALKRPQPAPKHPIVHHKKAAAASLPKQAVQPSAHIRKFAPHPSAQPKHHQVMDIAPTTHPHVAKAHAISQKKAERPLPDHPKPRETAVHQSPQSTITQAIANTTPNHTEHPKKKLLHRRPRAVSIMTASFALVLLGGYLTYLNMPSLSVRVAAAQAGINANYPNYQPDGYSLNGLVGYSQGKVSMKFAANSSPQGYTINQTKSNWDSAAVLDNYVTPRAGVSYIPYTERGLTIYTYGNNAAWVNGGILYTIEGDAPLSSEQIRRIATSLI